MASLHSALQALGPVDFVDIPTSPEALDPYVADLHSQAQLILESIPIAPPDESDTRPRSNTTTSIASNASEMSTSSARSAPPAAEYAALQKEWGKPLKLSQKENPMGISVYKVGGKDSRGAWFARRSVHEGLGFARFKRGFEKEFPTSLAVQGAPGEGNIRGIGAETRVEDINVPDRGKVQVYRLTAQFPGPTTPRDFVTLLVTSSKGMKPNEKSTRATEPIPRHYMIVSKPCNHPDTQPAAGFIRGQYESVEFIREIPRKLKTSMSSTDLSSLGHKRTPTLEKETLIRNTAKKTHFSAETDAHSDGDDKKTPRSSREASPSGRRRSATVGVPESSSNLRGGGDSYDPEDNPVEWIMVTRSDPGGSVPRFMVERGTPSSICADAKKFLDWACQRDDEDEIQNVRGAAPKPVRRESFASWEANGHLAGINEQSEGSRHVVEETQPSATPSQTSSQVLTPSGQDTMASSGILASVTGTLSSYTPQVILDHIGGATPKPSPGLRAVSDLEKQTSQGLPPPDSLDDDGASTISSTSFASADSHFGSEEDPSISSRSLNDQPETLKRQPTSAHEKELAKLSAKKAALVAKIEATRSKAAASATKDSEKEQLALKKAEAKHEQEVKKQEERYQRELEKLEAKKQKEAKKQADRKRKQADKDEKAKLTRERDEARAELELLKKEQEVWMKQIGELQKENTALVARVGKLDGSNTATAAGGSDAESIGGASGTSPGNSPGRSRGITIGSVLGVGTSGSDINRSRSSTLLGKGEK